MIRRSSAKSCRTCRSSASEAAWAVAWVEVACEAVEVAEWAVEDVVAELMVVDIHLRILPIGTNLNWLSKIIKILLPS